MKFESTFGSTHAFLQLFQWLDTATEIIIRKEERENPRMIFPRIEFASVLTRWDTRWGRGESQQLARLSISD